MSKKVAQDVEEKYYVLSPEREAADAALDAELRVELRGGGQVHRHLVQRQRIPNLQSAVLTPASLIKTYFIVFLKDSNHGT